MTSNSPESVNVPSASPDTSFSFKEKALAYFVHCYTASGIIFTVLALVALIEKRFHMVYFWNCIAVIIDSSDGYFARKFRVKEIVPHIDGRKLDDIIDFCNYTFLPLMLIWRMGILPEPGWMWICFPMLASLFAFVYEGVKEENTGFYVGFPSYWNFFVIYAEMAFYPYFGSWFTLGFMLVLTALNVLPLRFVYPSLAKRWRGFFVWGAILWTVVFLYMLTLYPTTPQAPRIPGWLVWASFTYPALYCILSMYLDWDARRAEKKAKAQEA